MSRIAKSDVVASFNRAAAQIRAADTNGNGQVSRAEIKAKIETLSGKEKSLVSIFYKFADHRDYVKGARITGKDLQKTIAYSAKNLVADYDRNNNGLSKREIFPMSTTARFAVEWAKEFKAQPAPTAPTAPASPAQGMPVLGGTDYTSSK